MGKLAEAQITADTISIGDLLSGDRRLSVPAYQRPYDWKKDEASDLLDDLLGAVDGKYSPFFGTVVIDISDEKELQIIDGQQRITTFNLLLIALRTLLNKNGTVEDVRLATKIHGVLSYDNRTSGKSTDSVSRLDPSISIKDAFIPIAINPDWNGLEYSAGRTKSKVNKKIKPILDFFIEELSGLDHDKISELLHTLYRGYVVVLKIVDKTQALEIFERANVRGMELNAADLLKSFFVSSIDDEKDVDLENKWIEIVSNTENVIRMIKHFGWTMFKKKIVANRNQFYAELKKEGQKKGGKTLLEMFESFAQAYGIVESGEVEDVIKWAGETDLGKEQKAISFVRPLLGLRLFRIAQAYPLIAAAMVHYKNEPSGTSASALIELVTVLEKYHFINSYICQRRGNEVETLYAEKSKLITERSRELSELINEIKNRLKNQLADFKEFEPKFSELTYDSSASVLKSIYYIFDRLENTGRKGREIDQIFNPKLAVVKGDWEVEHILPQSPTTANNFENIDETVNSVGNLLVVPSGTNKEVGNLPVNDKVLIYKKKIGKMSSVMAFCDAFQAGALGSFDTENAVKFRVRELARELYGKAFAISSEQEKVLLSEV